MTFKLIVYYDRDSTEASAELGKAVTANKWRIDQGLAILRKSDVKTEKTLTMKYMIRDLNNEPEWRGNQWKVGQQDVFACECT